jgi:transcriptional regulator with PAS, ATPase and Fis domain
MKEVKTLAARASGGDAKVLITGESGVGKDVIARYIHAKSHRSQRPFIAVNCAAFSETLLESELFGHVKGAFTNAVSDRKGRFATADGGTIFLDEIGDMSPNLQVKLLRVLQERSFEPVGSSKTQNVDVRVVAATHQDLPKLIEEKTFREDLYYRLNVLPIEVPSLRRRRDDIPLLVHHFLDIARNDRGSRVDTITDAAMERLMDHDWPGNVRELENVIERICVLTSEGTVDVEHLPEPLQNVAKPKPMAPVVPSTGLSFNDTIEQLEVDLLQQALEHTHWNKNRAAQLLGLNRTTLLEKIKKRGLVQPTD